MGWIEIAVYRERRPFVRAWPYARPERPRPYPIEAEGGRAETPAPDSSETRAPRSAEAPAPGSTADASPALEQPESNAPAGSAPGAQARSYPGTGWGDRAHDTVVLVSFDAEPEPRERVTLRYEYRPALVALGVLPARTSPRDRLWQRDAAEPGFAQPPRW
jgi:hypothetical protein